MAKDNHHFVPQGYLRGFTIEGERSLIWEYDKETGKVSHQPRSIREVCAGHHYYAQKRADGSVDSESMEDAFHEIENKAPRVIRDISLLSTGSRVLLSEENRAILSFFAALQLFRVPSFREGIEELHRKMVEMQLGHVIEAEKNNGALPELIEELFEQGGIKIDIERFVSLEPMAKSAEHGAEILLEKVWHFAAPAKGMTFVTSDNPIYFRAPEEYRKAVGPNLGPMNPMSEITFPLRKDLVLIFSPSFERTQNQYRLLDCTSVQLNKSDTKKINKRIALAAARYVYSAEKSEALARMVGKCKGSSQRVVV